MPTVLIVDDDNMTCKMLVRLLATIKVTGQSVTSGVAAFEYLRRHVPDLILLDLMMPEMDGIAALTKIRNDEQLKDIPVIMYTAADDLEAADLARQLGVNEYWIKGSVDIATMENRLNHYFRQAA